MPFTTYISGKKPFIRHGYYRAGYSLIKWSQNSDKVSSCDEAAGMFCEGLKVLDEKTISLQFVSICKQLVNDYYSLSVWQQKYVLFGQYEKMERIPKLVEWLISIGADIRSIGAYPLHAVIILCIKAKGSYLFRWLLVHKPELKDLINQQNEDGSTVLHVVASHSNGYSIKNQIEDVVMLLKAGVNPQICDAQSRSAVDILKRHKKFKAVDIISKHISQHVPSPEESPGQTENKTPEDAAALLQNAFEQFSQFCCMENRARSIKSLTHKSIKELLRLLHTKFPAKLPVMFLLPVPAAS
ncbi:TPR and ankyrin repeat-containing protein 1 [Varanus komodoensis]|nr:TPR and ankyrin repeat-containing protein 1 [Varanus komodoensis]